MYLYTASFDPGTVGFVHDSWAKSPLFMDITDITIFCLVKTMTEEFTLLWFHILFILPQNDWFLLFFMVSYHFESLLPRCKWVCRKMGYIKIHQILHFIIIFPFKRQFPSVYNNHFQTPKVAAARRASLSAGSITSPGRSKATVR